MASPYPIPGPKEKKEKWGGGAVVIVLWTVNNSKMVLWSYVVCENDHRFQIIAWQMPAQ